MSKPDTSPIQFGNGGANAPSKLDAVINKATPAPAVAPVAPVAPVAQQPAPAQSKKIKSRFNRQINVPIRTPFNLGGHDFQNDKRYYVNLQHVFRTKEPEEALKEFIKHVNLLQESVMDNTNVLVEEYATGSTGEKVSTILAEFIPPDKAESITDYLLMNYNEFFGNVSKAIPTFDISTGNIEQSRRPYTDKVVDDIFGNDAGFDANEKSNIIANLNDIVQSLYGVFQSNIEYDEVDTDKEIQDSKEKDGVGNVIPFNADGSVRDFEAFKKIMINRMIIATRNDAGVTPYSIINTYLDGDGIRTQEDIDKTLGKSRINTKTMEDIINSGALENDLTSESTDVKDALYLLVEFLKTPRTNDSQRWNPMQQRNRGGVVYNGNQGQSQDLGAERVSIGTVTPDQVFTFHNEVVKYFIKTGLLLYLKPQEWVDLRAGAMTAVSFLKGVATVVNALGGITKSPTLT